MNEFCKDEGGHKLDRCIFIGEKAGIDIEKGRLLFIINVRGVEARTVMTDSEFEVLDKLIERCYFREVTNE